jgi:opacity protein-like surface antigen
VNRYLQSAAVVTALLAAGPAFAADLVVDATPATIEPPAHSAYASFFGGAELTSADVTATTGGIPIGFTIPLDYDAGFIVGGTVGTEVLPSLRGEIEFSVMQASVSEVFGVPADMTTTSYDVLGNLWYDVNTDSSFTPYIGGGVGYGFNVSTIEGAPDDIDSSGVIYQLGGGVRLAATGQIGLDLGYRYRVQPDANITSDLFPLGPDDELKSNANAHIVQAGVTVGF